MREFLLSSEALGDLLEPMEFVREVDGLRVEVVLALSE